VIPPDRDRVDGEGEFAVVVGREAKGLTLDNAMDYVFGFTIMDDISDRAAQIPEDGRYERNWYAGKSMDGDARRGHIASSAAIPTGPTRRARPDREPASTRPDPRLRS